MFMPSWFIAWNWLFTMSDFNYPWADIGYALGYFTKLIQAADLGFYEINSSGRSRGNLSDIFGYFGI